MILTLFLKVLGEMRLLRRCFGHFEALIGAAEVMDALHGLHG